MTRSVLSLSAALLVLGSGGAFADVVISEIHYHSSAADARGVEFVEIHNPGAAPVDIGGWRIKGGVDFTIPEGRLLPAGAYLAIAKDRAAVQARFGPPEGAVLGGFKDFLENSGETVTLVDRGGAFVDSVTYDDEAPWDAEADGEGSSLHRLCATSTGATSLNWEAADPTPGAPYPSARCPQPSYVTPPVVFSEIQYHPLIGALKHPANTDGEDEEFLELHNPGSSDVDLGGWRLDGVDLVFPAGTRIVPGGYLVVGRNSIALRAKLISNVLPQSYTGRLSNRGERIALLDSRGTLVDALTYADAEDWPSSPDGVGRSLEKVVVTAAGSDPANWKASTVASGVFQHLVGDGPKGQGLGQRIVLSINGAGTVIVDNVLLEQLAGGDPVVVVSESFDTGLGQWLPAGVASDSSHAPGEGVGGSGALRLKSRAPCPNGECGSANSVSLSVSLPNPAALFRISVDVRYLSGSPSFRAGLFRGATASLDQISTPGKANSVAALEVPVAISHVNRFPREPRSTDTTWISARVRSRLPATVTLTYDDGPRGGEVTLPMFDDGSHDDRLSGDGVYGVELPAFRHNTEVLFRVRAEAGGMAAESPIPFLAGTPQAEEWWGYYVNDFQPEADLPLHNLIFEELPGADINAINGYFGNCTNLRRGSFAYKGDLYPEVNVRFRGNTACYIKKRNFKVIFNRGRLFRGLKKVNLNGSWTDKALVRERLAWEFFREIGAPYCETEFTRVHFNGEYMGLYLYLEHPDDRFLERNGLDSGGNLYKAKQPPNSGTTPIGVAKQGKRDDYRNFWEEETNEGGDFADIQEFIDAMHLNGAGFGGPTSDFWLQRTFPEIGLGYQYPQAVLNNIDSFAKNHFLYHDLQSNQWGMIGWDMDLVFGKFFTLNAVGPGREVGTLNDLMLSDMGFDLNPWFGATVLGNPLLQHYVDFLLRAGKGSFQRAYLVRLWDMLEEKYTNAVYDPILDDLEASLAPEEALDFAKWGRYPSNVPGYPQDMHSNIQIMKEQLKFHRDFLREFVQQFHAEIPSHPRLKITEVMYAPENGDDDLEFLEIVNVGPSEVDIGGWSITGIGKETDFVFPVGAKAQSGVPFIVARKPNTFRLRYPEVPGDRVFGPYGGKLADEGEELRLLDAGPDYPATIDYLNYDNEGAWPDILPGQSIELTGVALDRDNDPPGNWRGSAPMGGTPGTLEPVFVRSNVNGDARTDLTDVIVLLAYLHQGGQKPSCLDAGDTDDDGSLSITDAIYLLLHLFQGGPAPPPPYPAEGTDPTGDELGCV